MKGFALTLWVAVLLATNGPAPAQDAPVATEDDVIMARRTLMTTLSDSFDKIEAMIMAGKIDLPDAKERADTISVMLMVFPHLFPANSNLWKPDVEVDPVTGTFASPDVWSKYSDFYQRAAAASKSAFDISRADNETELKSAAKELRSDCNDCHGAYLKQ